MEKECMIDECKDPLTFTIFVNPITLKCGHTFERCNIYNMLLKKSSSTAFQCPLCNKQYYTYGLFNIAINVTLTKLIDIIEPGYRDKKMEEVKKQEDDLLKIFGDNKILIWMEKLIQFLEYMKSTEMTCMNITNEEWLKFYSSEKIILDKFLKIRGIYINVNNNLSKLVINNNMCIERILKRI